MFYLWAFGSDRSGGRDEIVYEWHSYLKGIRARAGCGLGFCVKKVKWWVEAFTKSFARRRRPRRRRQHLHSYLKNNKYRTMADTGEGAVPKEYPEFPGEKLSKRCVRAPREGPSLLTFFSFFLGCSHKPASRKKEEVGFCAQASVGWKG